MRKLHAAHLAFAVRLYGEERRKGIDSLGTHTVQTHGFLEGLAVVFTAGIEDRDYLHQFAQRDTASVVAHTYHLMAGI